jgi:hypothetical protein
MWGTTLGYGGATKGHYQSKSATTHTPESLTSFALLFNWLYEMVVHCFLSLLNAAMTPSLNCSCVLFGAGPAL